MYYTQIYREVDTRVDLVQLQGGSVTTGLPLLIPCISIVFSRVQFSASVTVTMEGNVGPMSNNNEHSNYWRELGE